MIVLSAQHLSKAFGVNQVASVWGWWVSTVQARAPSFGC